MAEEKRGRGRPPGKKSDPDYTTLTVYVRKKTIKAIKKNLIDLDMDASELVETLLQRWIEENLD